MRTQVEEQRRRMSWWDWQAKEELHACEEVIWHLFPRYSLAHRSLILCHIIALIMLIYRCGLIFCNSESCSHFYGINSQVVDSVVLLVVRPWSFCSLSGMMVAPSTISRQHIHMPAVRGSQWLCFYNYYYCLENDIGWNGLYDWRGCCTFFCMIALCLKVNMKKKSDRE